MKTEWKTIRGFKNRYKVSNYGEVMSINYRRQGIKKLLQPNINASGYIYYNLNERNYSSKISAHRLVANAFINNDNPINKTQVNHKDGNKHNNKVFNLEWMSPSDNRKHGINNGLITFKYGQAHNSAVLTDKQHQYIKELYNLNYNKTQLADIFNVSRPTIIKYLNQ